MKKFVRNLILFIILLTFTFAALATIDFFLIGSQFRYGYQASLIDKMQRLESIDVPKIILVGNSNVAFGFMSEMIENEFNMPVVNMGLHGSMGNAFHEEIAKINISKGDIVVVCHTWFADNDDIGDKTLAWITIDNNKNMFRIIRKKDFPGLLLAYPNFLRKSILLWLTNHGNRDSGDCYSRNAFNQYGDVVYKPAKDQMDVDMYFKKTKIDIPKINDTCVNRLNLYNQYINDKGAKVVIAGFPIAYGQYNEWTPDDLRHFQNSLQSRLDFPIISDYCDYLFPYSAFYNSKYHLTAEGAELRTSRFIKDLGKQLYLH